MKDVEEVVTRFLQELGYSNKRISDAIADLTVGGLGDNILLNITTSMAVIVNFKKLVNICNRYTGINTTYYYTYSANSLTREVTIKLIERSF